MVGAGVVALVGGMVAGDAKRMSEIVSACPVCGAERQRKFMALKDEPDPPSACGACLAYLRVNLGSLEVKEEAVEATGSYAVQPAQYQSVVLRNGDAERSFKFEMPTSARSVVSLMHPRSGISWTATRPPVQAAVSRATSFTGRIAIPSLARRRALARSSTQLPATSDSGLREAFADRVPRRSRVVLGRHADVYVVSLLQGVLYAQRHCITATGMTPSP